MSRINRLFDERELGKNEWGQARGKWYGEVKRGTRTYIFLALLSRVCDTTITFQAFPGPRLHADMVKYRITTSSTIYTSVLHMHTTAKEVESPRNDFVETSRSLGTPAHLCQYHFWSWRYFQNRQIPTHTTLLIESLL